MPLLVYPRGVFVPLQSLSGPSGFWAVMDSFFIVLCCLVDCINDILEVFLVCHFLVFLGQSRIGDILARLPADRGFLLAREGN